MGFTYLKTFRNMFCEYYPSLGL